MNSEGSTETQTDDTKPSSDPDGINNIKQNPANLEVNDQDKPNDLSQNPNDSTQKEEPPNANNEKSIENDNDDASNIH